VGNPLGVVGISTLAGLLRHLPVATGESPLQQVSPLVWVMVAISAAGAIVTFAFLVYAIVKFRDPNTRRRRYG
jgi:heme/copper-type cytochrome/quinol oxidase subunit 2